MRCVPARRCRPHGNFRPGRFRGQGVPQSRPCLAAEPSWGFLKRVWREADVQAASARQRRHPHGGHQGQRPCSAPLLEQSASEEARAGRPQAQLRGYVLMAPPGGLRVDLLTTGAPLLLGAGAPGKKEGPGEKGEKHGSAPMGPHAANRLSRCGQRQVLNGA